MRIYTTTNREEDILGLSDLLKEKRRTRKLWQRETHCKDKIQINLLTWQIRNLISLYKLNKIDKDLKSRVKKENLQPIIHRFTKKHTSQNHPLHGSGGLTFEPNTKKRHLTQTSEDVQMITHMNASTGEPERKSGTSQLLLLHTQCPLTKPVIKH